MGTDNLGRDIFDAVVHGARTSMVVVLGVSAIASVIGLAVGIVAGYRGGWIDDLLMRITELFQSVPRFFLVLLIVALFGAGLDNLIYVLAFTSWPTLARVSRAEVLSVRDRDYVEAARSIGATDRRIVLRHVLPNVLPTATGRHRPDRLAHHPAGGQPELPRPRRPHRHELGLPGQQRPAVPAGGVVDVGVPRRWPSPSPSWAST